MFAGFYFGQAYFADGPNVAQIVIPAAPTGLPGTTINITPAA